jgi:hypothetical protein
MGGFGSPSNANDENPFSFWFNDVLSGSANQWWQVDLGNIQKINKVEIQWFDTNGTYNCTELFILGSNDGQNFTTVSGPINTSFSSLTGTYTFADTQYRYWRLDCRRGSHPAIFAIREASFFKSLDQPESTANACIDLRT